MSSVAWVKSCYSESWKILINYLFWSIIPITWWKCRSCKLELNSADKILKYSITLYCACSVMLNFPNKMASSRWEATESKLCTEVQIIRFSVTPIKKRSIFPIKDNFNVVVLYFFSDYVITRNLKAFRNHSNWGGIVPNNVQLHTKFWVCGLSSRTCHFIWKVWNYWACAIKCCWIF